MRGWQTIKSLYSIYFYHLSIVTLQLQAMQYVGTQCGCTATQTTIPISPRGTSKDAWALLKNERQGK